MLHTEEIACAVCKRVSRGDPQEEMLEYRREHVVIWAAHTYCCWKTVRAARIVLLPILRRMEQTGFKTRDWMSLRERLFDETHSRPDRFVRAVEDTSIALGSLQSDVLESGWNIPAAEYQRWLDDVTSVLKTFNVGPPAPPIDISGPQLRLISSTPPPA